MLAPVNVHFDALCTSSLSQLLSLLSWYVIDVKFWMSRIFDEYSFRRLSTEADVEYFLTVGCLKYTHRAALSRT